MRTAKARNPRQRMTGRHARSIRDVLGEGTNPFRRIRRRTRRERNPQPARAAEVGWYADGEIMRAAYTLHTEDDDWGQAGSLVRDVMDDAQRERLAHNIILHVRDGVKEPVLSRVFAYWRNVDPDLSDKVEQGVRANLNR